MSLALKAGSRWGRCPLGWVPQWKGSVYTGVKDLAGHTPTERDHGS